MNDGGNAFPTTREMYDGDDNYLVYEEGMTLRDYFAAKAMQGMHSCTDIDVSRLPLDLIAEYSYKQADAMLKQREVKND